MLFDNKINDKIILFFIPVFSYCIWLPELLYYPHGYKWHLAILFFTIINALFVYIIAIGKDNYILNFIESNARFIAMIIVIFAALTLMCINYYQWKTYSFGPYPEDLAYYNQVLWNTIHGDFLSGNLQQTRIYNPPVYSDLALHFSPVLLFVVMPIYYIFQHFMTLQVLKCLALALAAWPLFLMTERVIGGTAAVASVLLYLFNPAVITQGIGSFTLLTLAPLPYFFAFYSFTKDKFAGFFIWMIIALCVREEVAITIAGLGILALVSGKKAKWWLTTFSVTVLWWILVTLYVLPAFGRTGNSALDVALSGGGTSSLGAYQVLIADPTWLYNIFHNGGMKYIYYIFRNVGFLALTGIEAVAAIPQLISNLFLSRAHFSGNDPFSRFAMLASCALIGATILTVKRITMNPNFSRKYMPILLMVFLPSISILEGLKTVTQEQFLPYFQGNDPVAINEGLKRIPKDASVAAPTYILPVISDRKEIYTLQWLYMYPKKQIEYYVFDLNYERVTKNKNLQKRYIELYESMVSSPDYKEIWSRGEYKIFSRGNPYQGT